MEPTAKYILALKEDLVTKRFRNRDIQLKAWARLRFREPGQTVIPEEYQGTSVEVLTAEIENSGSAQTGILATSKAIAHVPPPTETQRARTTQMERWLNFGHAELEAKSPADAPVSDSQVHGGIGFYKCFPRRKEERWPDYPQPRNGEESDAEYLKRADDYKANQSLDAVFYYGFAPQITVYGRKDGRGIAELLEVKEVQTSDLLVDWPGFLSEIGLEEFSIPDLPVAVKVYEYWNRQYRAFVVEGTMKKGGRKLPKQTLNVWEHGFGLVPYFEAPAIETNEVDEEKRYRPLLAGLYAEAPLNNRLRTMATSVAFFTGWPFYYVKTIQTGELVMDPEEKTPRVFALVPGKMPQLGLGQEIVQIGLQAGEELRQAILDSDMRMLRYAAPDILQGQSPGADFPGVGLQKLHRLSVARLDPLAKGRAKALSEMYRFMLWSVKHVIGERVYVSGYDVAEGQTAKWKPIALAPDDIVSMNVSVKVEPDVPIDRIGLEKHGLELLNNRAISKIEFQQDYRGKENPEEILAAIEADKVIDLANEEIRLLVMEQLRGADAAARIIQGQTPEQEFARIKAERTALGKGSPGQPREEGLRMSPAPLAGGESPTFEGAAGAPAPVVTGVSP